MVCPFCLHEKTSIYNSRQGRRLNQTWRRRRCEGCRREFTTYEAADPGSILQIKDSRVVTNFSHTRLLMSVLKACDHRADSSDTVPYLCDTIEQKLYHITATTKNHWITKDHIVSIVAEVLKAFDPTAYVKYVSLYQGNLDAPTIRRALKRNK